MAKITSSISADGSVVCYAIDSTDIAVKAEQLHKTSATVTAALGRLLTAASLIGSQMKGEDHTLTMTINGGGPAGNVVAVSDSSGNVRGYVDNPIVEIPLNSIGKLDVAGAVGTDGFLTVLKDLRQNEPYVSRTPIVSGEIAEDITYYYALSEQTPSICALGVLVNPDLTVKAAGGYLVHVLPGAPEETIVCLEENLKTIPSVTKLLTEGKAPEEISEIVLAGFEIEHVGRFTAEYRCNCSRERIEKTLLSLGKEELLDLSKDEETEIVCHFCNKAYKLSSAEILRLRENG